jgi:hypothetical protein
VRLTRAPAAAELSDEDRIVVVLAVMVWFIVPEVLPV